MSRGFVWDKNRFFEADTVSDVHCFIDKGMVKESVNIVKKRKVAEPSRLVLEIVKSASNAGNPDYSKRSYSTNVGAVNRNIGSITKS